MQELREPVFPVGTTVYFFGPGESLPAKNEAEDQARKLTNVGHRQARFVGDILHFYRARIGLGIFAATERDRRTGLEALSPYFSGAALFKGIGRELYGPANDADFERLCTVERELANMDAVSLGGHIHAGLEHKRDILLVQFMEETRQVVRAAPYLQTAHGVLVVCGNRTVEVVDALFPQHAETCTKLLTRTVGEKKKVGLRYCECLRVTGRNCTLHTPLWVPSDD